VHCLSVETKDKFAPAVGDLHGVFTQTVGDLRKRIEGLDDKTPILCQVTGQELGSPVWYMQLLVGLPAHFKWEYNPIVFTFEHPELKRLPSNMKAE
jgi:hypothetical protein